MRIAAAAYPLDFLTSWFQYEEKISSWVSEASENGAELLVFPEYGAMELATLAGQEVARDLDRSAFAVSDRLDGADALHAALAQKFGVHILAGSAPVPTATRIVNRARLFAPSGAVGIQDKQIMTRFERDNWRMAAGGPLQVFDTDIGKLGVLICYDSEFPLLGRALKECEVILVPSCTEALSGYWRVRIGAMARALENQCVTVMAPLVGAAVWSEVVDISVGASGVFCPPDIGFPSTGVLAEAALNTPGWTYADVDLAKIAKVRCDGAVLGREHWIEQSGRDGAAISVELR